MAFLYRFELSLVNKEIPAVIVADSDDEAFTQLDIELEKYYLKLPEINEVTLREKKRITKKVGFILDE
ncbi:DUF3906 family protein [Cytobacillus sp. FSL K6-0265]|uniref:DUF3906 family protein n=1 Tax=Cytobacillus sp. FSL K6-0265 TaxID=2921448 RepID=UPI0030FA85F7